MIDAPHRRIDSLRGPSTTDLVFEELYRQVVELELPPGAKVSELEVAKRMGVSRQPVRDAFYRLSQVKLLRIQPQRATTIAPISEEAVLQARFIRTALEMETARSAAAMLEPIRLAELEDILARQQAAVERDDRIAFHRLDDDFHRAICVAAGEETVWSLIRVNKAHMDRVRYLSLSFGARSALDDHLAIMDALRHGDPDRAAQSMRVHLSRIADILAKIRAERPSIFTGAEE